MDNNLYTMFLNVYSKFVILGEGRQTLNLFLGKKEKKKNCHFETMCIEIKRKNGKK